MAKLSIPFPGSRDWDWDEDEESEIDASYEWRKGRHGPDVEIIGSRYPWVDENIIVKDQQ